MCALGMVCGMASCSDFLEVDDPNAIVLEHFWNEKADVDAIVYGCYSKLASEAVVARMMVWGEFRSDNISLGLNTNKDYSLVCLLKESIDASNAYTDWREFYSVINRCNTVLKYAPEVAENDLSYTTSDLKATIAEVTALRSLCYFYLIRTFRDVPYSKEAFTDDDQTMDLPATSFDEILADLISDLESVKDDAVVEYPVTQPIYQTARVTQAFIHAMLCEMYLWQGNYAQSVYYAELVLKAKADQQKSKAATSLTASTTDNLRLNGFPIISDAGTGSNYGQSYQDLFNDGNSKTQATQSASDICFTVSSEYELDGDNVPEYKLINADCNSQTALVEATAANISVAPTFVIDNIVISAPTNIIAVSVYNVAGQQVAQKAVNSTNTSLNLSNLASGMYILSIQTADTQSVQNIIKK